MAEIIAFLFLFLADPWSAAAFQDDARFEKMGRDLFLSLIFSEFLLKWNNLKPDWKRWEGNGEIMGKDGGMMGGVQGDTGSILGLLISRRGVEQR